MTADFYEQLMSQAAAETERIENRLRECMMNIKKEHQKKEYILQHQVNTEDTE